MEQELKRQLRQAQRQIQKLENERRQSAADYINLMRRVQELENSK